VTVAVAEAVAAIDLITVTLWHLKLNLFQQKKGREKQLKEMCAH